MIKNMQGMNPNACAQMYANQKGITKEEAIAELKSKYGDPSKDGAGAPQNSILDSKTDENELASVELDDEADTTKAVGTQKEETEESKSVDRDAVISALVSEAGISKTEATAALKALGIEDGSEQVDPATKLADFVEATGLSEDAAKAFLQKYVGEPKKDNK